MDSSLFEDWMMSMTAFILSGVATEEPPNFKILITGKIENITDVQLKGNTNTMGVVGYRGSYPVIIIIMAAMQTGVIAPIDSKL